MSAYLRPSSVKNLDAKVDIFMGGVAPVVAIYLAEQNDGGRARSFGLAGHLQFVR